MRRSEPVPDTAGTATVAGCEAVGSRVVQQPKHGFPSHDLSRIETVVVLRLVVKMEIERAGARVVDHVVVISPLRDADDDVLSSVERSHDYGVPAQADVKCATEPSG